MSTTIQAPAKLSIPFGTFTVVSDSGGHRTLRLKPTDDWATSVPKGSVFVQELAYSNKFEGFCFILPDGSIRRFRKATDSAMAALMALLTGDYEAMGLAYAMASGRCWKCGRELTVPASIHRGMGPDCAGQYDQAPRFTFTAPRQGLPAVERPSAGFGVTGHQAGLNGSAPMPVLTREAPPQPVKPSSNPEVWIEGDTVYVRLTYGESNFYARKEAVKRLGAKWDDPNKRWGLKVDPVNAGRISKGLADAGIVMDETVAAEFYLLANKADTFRAMATAATSAFEAQGLADGLSLMPFQRAGVEHIVNSGRVLLADEMGLGKTVQALAAIAHLEAYPALIVVPASLKLNWRREANRWIPGANVTVLTGTDGHPLLASSLKGKAVVICNYDILGAYQVPKDPKTKKPVEGARAEWTSKGWGRWLEQCQWAAIVADESHYAKNPRAGRTTAMVRLLKAVNPRLGLLLSGTPMTNRPIELWPQLDMLGYGQSFGGKMAFARHYCQAVETRFGWDMSGASMGTELNDRLKALGAYVRRRKEDVLTELPPKRYATVPLAMSDEAVYAAAERDCIGWFHALPSRQARMVQEAEKEWSNDPALQIKSGLSEYVKAQVEIRFNRSARAEQLVRFEALKTAAWKAKSAAVVSWVDEFLEGSDKKLILFAHHTEVVDSLAARFHAPKIQGGMNVADVEAAKVRFQEDADCRVIVCNLQAGGMGHTLTAASDVAFIEFPWTPFLLDQATDRAHRIGQQDAVTGWLLVAERSSGAETIEGEIVSLLEQKRVVGDAVMDGKEADDEAGSVFGQLAEIYVARA